MTKVHGSLARDGKDKKEKPRGRAHKRMQYNRRLVTAAVGFRKKR